MICSIKEPSMLCVWVLLFALFVVSIGSDLKRKLENRVFNIVTLGYVLAFLIGWTVLSYLHSGQWYMILLSFIILFGILFIMRQFHLGYDKTSWGNGEMMWIFIYMVLISLPQISFLNQILGWSCLAIAIAI